MNTRIKVGGKIGGAATRVIQVSPQAPATGIEMPLNSAGFTDRELRTNLVQMAKSSTLQDQAIGFD